MRIVAHQQRVDAEKARERMVSRCVRFRPEEAEDLAKILGVPAGFLPGQEILRRSQEAVCKDIAKLLVDTPPKTVKKQLEATARIVDMLVEAIDE